MDLDQMKELDYYEVVVGDSQVLKELDTLLRRILGCNVALIIKTNANPVKWTFYFWATRSEFNVIKTLLDDLNSQKLDEEYEKLINETT